jgi:hypothetical protein
MLIPFGVLSAAAGGAPGPVVPSDYELISTNILAGAASSVTFSSLGDYSSTYKHLQVRATLRVNDSSGVGNLFMRLNGDTGNNYAWHFLRGNGSSVTSGATTSTNYMQVGLVPYANQTGFYASVIDLLDPYAAKNKTLRALSGGATGTNLIDLDSGLWLNTASLTSLELSPSSLSFGVGCRFSLYGIKG